MIILLRRRTAVGSAAIIGVFLVASVPGSAASRSWMDRGGPGVFNHPVGVRPSSAVRIPSGWPLGRDGSLTCFTCHEGVPDSTRSNGANLRPAPQAMWDSSDFCATCHAGGESANSIAAHWQAIGVAHVRPDRDARGGSTALDSESRQCLSCHDGVSAPDSTNGGAGHGSFSFAEAGRNHPIGVRYPLSTPRNYDVRFRMASLLPAEIRLPGGTVGCVSCHNVYAPDRAKLTVPIEGSALCMTCHEMD